jgi:hypothetical protein
MITRARLYTGEVRTPTRFLTEVSSSFATVVEHIWLALYAQYYLSPRETASGSAYQGHPSLTLLILSERG